MRSEIGSIRKIGGSNPPLGTIQTNIRGEGGSGITGK